MILSQPRRLSTEIVHLRGTNTEQLGNREQRVAKDPKGSQFTATTEINAGRKSVELVQMVSRPLLTPVHFKCTFLLLLSLTRQS
jgi:hypothetical protein